MVTKFTPEQILALPLAENDAGAATVKDFLKALLTELRQEKEGFSGKRPFGNSGWEHPLEVVLVKAGAVEGVIFQDPEEGFAELTSIDEEAAHKLIHDAITSL